MHLEKESECFSFDGRSTGGGDILVKIENKNIIFLSFISNKICKKPMSNQHNSSQHKASKEMLHCSNCTDM